jgi:hypothetical protein
MPAVFLGAVTIAGWFAGFLAIQTLALRATPAHGLDARVSYTACALDQVCRIPARVVLTCAFRQYVHDRNNLSPDVLLADICICWNDLRYKSLPASLRLALPLLGSCTCSVDACGGPGTASALRAMRATLSGVLDSILAYVPT